MTSARSSSASHSTPASLPSRPEKTRGAWVNCRQARVAWSAISSATVWVISAIRRPKDSSSGGTSSWASVSTISSGVTLSSVTPVARRRSISSARAASFSITSSSRSTEDCATASAPSPVAASCVTSCATPGNATRRRGRARTKVRSRRYLRMSHRACVVLGSRGNGRANPVQTSRVSGSANRPAMRDDKAIFLQSQPRIPGLSAAYPASRRTMVAWVT